MQELEELLARRDRPEKNLEGGFCCGFRTLDQISAGWDLFYRLERQIEQSKLIIRD